jgi:hypothetical protein
MRYFSIAQDDIVKSGHMLLRGGAGSVLVVLS